jgi:hypothetical protein
MQAVTHWPSTQVWFEQSAFVEHSETFCQFGWQMPWSQKSAGFVQSVSAAQSAWQVALMHVAFAPQSALKMQATVGFGFSKQFPSWQVSPVPHRLSDAQAWWQRPSFVCESTTQRPPAPHWPDESQVFSGFVVRAVLHTPPQQASPAAQSLSTEHIGFVGAVQTPLTQARPQPQSLSVVHCGVGHAPVASHAEPSGQVQVVVVGVHVEREVSQTMFSGAQSASDEQ